MEFLYCHFQPSAFLFWGNLFILQRLLFVLVNKIKRAENIILQTDRNNVHWHFKVISAAFNQMLWLHRLGLNVSIIWFSSKVTTLNSNFLIVYSSENVLFLYLHLIWLYGSWNHQRTLKKHPFWKYDRWFSSEVSKVASVRNKLIMSLKYWFMEAKNVFRSCYVPKNDQNII